MKKKQMLKRFMAMLLTAILCISACPGNVAYATEDTGTDITEDTTGDAGDAGESTGDEIIPNDETGIPDKALYDYVLKNTDGKLNEADGQLSVAEAAFLTNFSYEVDENLQQSAIGSFKNISTYLTGLISFTYGINNVNTTDRVALTVDDLQELKTLQNDKEGFWLRLWAVEMNQEAADVLGELENLVELSISHSTIPTYAFLESDKLAGLESLGLGFCGLESIPDISHMTNLESLYLRSNKLVDLPDLTGMVSLKLDDSQLWENYFTKEVLWEKLPETYRTDEFIQSVCDRQTRSLACALSVGIEGSEVKAGDTIPVTLTVTNTGTELENVLVNLACSDCVGGLLALCPTGYELDEEGNVQISVLKKDETLTFNYEVTTGEDGQWTSDHVKFDAEAYFDDYVSARASSYDTFSWIDIKSEDEGSNDSGNTGDTGNSGTEEAEPLDITVKEVTVSNKTVVVTDAEPIAQVNVSVAVEGDDVANIPSGNYIFMYFTADDKNEFLGQLYYNAETKAYEGIIPFAGNAYTEGQYKITKFSMYTGTSPYRQDLAYVGDSTFVTYTNNTTDQVSPVLEGVQVYVNGVAQTGTTFTLKKGDTISVRADVTEESQLSGQILLYPDLNAIETAKLMEMMNAGTLRINMYATEYDLEGEKIMNEPFYEGEYHIYYVFIQDRCYNSNHYFEDSLASLYKEVAPNPSNVGLVESETTSEALKKLETNIADVISKEGAVNETTKTKVENALKNGETISVSLQVTNVPENSVDADKKADIQKKADDVFGENTKLVYMDITMNLFSSGSADTLGELKELEEKVTITVNLPEELKGDYNYKVIRSHEKADGTVEVEVLDAVKNEDGTISFETDRFSTYAIAYSTNEANNSTDDSNNNDSTDDSNNNDSNDDSDDNDSSDDSNNNDSSNDSDNDDSNNSGSNGDSNNNGSNGGSNNNGSTNNGTTNNVPTTDNTAVNAVSPTTGDNSMMGFYMVVIAALIVAVVVSKKMHKVS